LRKDKLKKSKKIWSKGSSVSFGKSEAKSSLLLNNKKKKRRGSELKSLRLSTEDKWILNKER
jgi:hypothetical protein